MSRERNISISPAFFVAMALLLLLLSPSVQSRETDQLIGGFPRRHLDDSSIGLIQENFRLFTNYVSKRIGREIILEPIKNLDVLRRRLEARELDFTWAWTEIESIKIWDEYPLTPFVAIDPIKDGVDRKGYRHLLITRSDNNYRNLDDLRGKTLIYMNSGDGLFKNISLLFVEVLLKKSGKDINTFFKLFPYGSEGHEETSSVSLEYGRSRDVILRVLSDPDLVASVNEEAYLLMVRRNPKVGEMIRIFAASNPSPPSPYFVWQDSDAEILKKIKNILINMDKDPEGEEILRSIGMGKWKDVGEEDYSSLRKLMGEANKLGIKLKL